MIDLHTHILPGLDDGAKDLPYAVKMLEQAGRQGVRVIAATSHASAESEAAYGETLAALRPEAQKLGLELVPGMEYDIDRLPCSGFTGLRTIGNSSALLLDLKMSNLPPSLPQLFFELGRAGYQLVIAHPERLFHRHLEEVLSQLEPYEPYYQVNLGSLAGRYGPAVREAAWRLLDGGHCHWIASDGHRENHFRFQELRILLSRYYEERIVDRWLDINPQRLLAGEPVRAPHPAKLNWFQRWRRRREAVIA